MEFRSTSPWAITNPWEAIPPRIWAALGALSATEPGKWDVRVPLPVRALGTLLALAVFGAFTVKSAAQLLAMGVYDGADRVADLLLLHHQVLELHPVGVLVAERQRRGGGRRLAGGGVRVLAELLLHFLRRGRRRPRLEVVGGEVATPADGGRARAQTGACPAACR